MVAKKGEEFLTYFTNNNNFLKRKKKCGTIHVCSVDEKNVMDRRIFQKTEKKEIYLQEKVKKLICYCDCLFEEKNNFFLLCCWNVNNSNVFWNSGIEMKRISSSGKLFFSVFICLNSRNVCTSSVKRNTFFFFCFLISDSICLCLTSVHPWVFFCMMNTWRGFS